MSSTAIAAAATASSTAAASASPTTTVSLSLDNTLGALYVGVVIGMALWGVGSVQMYYYFSRFPKDDWRMKLLVVVVWILDTLHQALVTHACYVYLITEYANVLYLFHLEPTLEYMVLVSAITCLLVQSFLVYRIWRLSHKNIFLVAVLMLIVIVEFSAVTAFFGRGIQLSSFTEVPTISWLSKLANCLMVASDIGVAASLIFYLNRSRTGFKRSETIINRLIVFTINTGLLTSVFAAMSLIFVSLYPNALIYVAFFICVSKLYVNTFLATLNTRKSASDGGAAPTTGDSHSHSQSISLSALRSNARVRVRGVDAADDGKLAIKVDTEIMSDVGSGMRSLPYVADAYSAEYSESYDAKRAEV